MIYDCFTFFNELDLLELRLHTLNAVIDRFVIVESTRTFQGNPKTLFFHDNKERFSAFSHKIIHVVVDTFPEGISNAWDYERYQRNQIAAGLTACKPNDIIIVSDVDEIPNPQKIVEASQTKGYKIFRQKAFYFFLNGMMDNGRESWNGPIMTDFKFFTSAQQLRDIIIRSAKTNNPKAFKRVIHRFVYSLKNLFRSNPVTILGDGGWHFSYIGGAEKIIQKLEAFSHTELNTPEFKDTNKINTLIQQGRSFFGDGKFSLVPIDEQFPVYLQQNQHRFAEYIRQTES